MKNCSDILPFEADTIWIDDCETKSTFTISMFTCCTLGMVVSTTAIVLLLLTAILFAEWRKIYKNQLLIQFMLARYLFTLVRYETEFKRFVSGREMEFYRNYIEVILIMYTEITLVAWMFLFTKQMYDNFVRVLFVEITLWKISLAAWIVPIVITAFIFFSCVYKRIDNSISAMVYLLITKWPVLVANGVLLIIILKTILSDNKSRKIKNRRIMLVMIILIVSFSFQQIFCDTYNLFNTLSEVDGHHSHLFFKVTNMFAMYQCAASIFFWLFGNERTRIIWGFQKDKCIKKKISLTSVSTINITQL